MCVLMAHYRLAPEHPFPAAVRDGVTAYRWLRRQGHPASRIMVIGDSAGGNLALTTAVSLRDSGDALPSALVSISPVTDFTLSGDTVRTKDAVEGLLTKGTREYTVRSYAGATDPHHPLLSPLYADLRGLPPTLLMVGSQEVLLSDSLRMADRLRAARVPVRLEVWPGVPHSWNGARRDTMETRLALQHICTFVRPLVP
jgi:acetyl esterase/lipase